jgi:hypothetical protein
MRRSDRYSSRELMKVVEAPKAQLFTTEGTETERRRKERTSEKR